jgi:hypothetical protein
MLMKIIIINIFIEMKGGVSCHTETEQDHRA